MWPVMTVTGGGMWGGGWGNDWILFVWLCCIFLLFFCILFVLLYGWVPWRPGTQTGTRGSRLAAGDLLVAGSGGVGGIRFVVFFSYFCVFFLNCFKPGTQTGARMLHGIWTAIIIVNCDLYMDYSCLGWWRDVGGWVGIWFVCFFVWFCWFLTDSLGGWVGIVIDWF